MRRQYIPWRDLLWAVPALHLVVWVILPFLGFGAAR
jgi:hypothetical protein